MSREKYIEQFKTVADIEKVVSALIEEYRVNRKKPLGVMFRVAIPPNDATTYTEGTQGPHKLVAGVRVCDYAFESSTNTEWVIPHPRMGLSFSKTLGHLKRTRKMLSRHAKGYKQPGPANIAWWILEDRDIPKDMAFVQDPDDKQHYFLTVTKRMHVMTLARNLKQIAYKMTIMKDLSFGA